jgi:hypothetical protein
MFRMRTTYELEDWEWRLIIRMRQLIREQFRGLIHVDLSGRAIVALVNTHVEHLEPAAVAVVSNGAKV